MLNPRENMVIIDGQIKTSQIARCSISDSGDRYNIAFKNNTSKTFSYGRNRAVWLTNPVIFEPQHCHLYHNGKQLSPLAFIAVFQRGYQKYWYVEYFNGAYASYNGEDISIVKSCLEDQPSKSVFEYLRSVPSPHPIEIKGHLRRKRGTLWALRQNSLTICKLSELTVAYALSDDLVG